MVVAAAPADTDLGVPSAGDLSVSETRLSFVLQPTPEPPADDKPPVAVVSQRTPRPFGVEGDEWITIYGGVAHDFNNAWDTALYANYSRFFVDNVEFGLEAALWNFSQTGDDAQGLSGSMFFRWHFVNRQSYSLFFDAGIGVMVATDLVPDEGTGFNFMPRAGGGATFKLGGSGARLITGLRWHHISNARIHGEERNPSRDAPMLYAGIMIPWS